ncbi:MAG TPA: response regulator [Thermodesulfovibrionales bacterium]|nr:response regulator [Thermodesulfovibrionales bacterium]
MKKILIIDDEPDITEIVSLFAEQLGFAADVSYSGDDAREKFASRKYWVVFCDLRMPGLSGLEIFAMFSQLDPEVKRRFVLITGALIDSDTEAIVRKKRITIFTKPFNFDAFQKILLSFEGNA